MQEVNELIRDTLVFLQECEKPFEWALPSDVKTFEVPSAQADIKPKQESSPVEQKSLLPTRPKEVAPEVPVYKPTEEKPRQPKNTPPPLALDAILKKVAPHMIPYPQPIAEEPHVLLLPFSPTGEELSFYKNLAKAIQTHLKPAKILLADPFEREKKWDLLLKNKRYPLILASVSLKTHEELFKESPVIFLASSYSHEEKLALWKHLQSLLSS